MAGFIREVRTVFTAQAGNFRSVTQGMQRDFRNIQTSGRNTAQSTDKDFGKMRTSLLGLQKELQGTGQKTQSLNKLQAVAHEVAAEMDRTGKASEQSMNRLREAMKAAGKDTKNFEKLGVSGFMALQNDIVNVEREMNGLGKTTTNVSSQASKGFAQIRKGAMLVTGALAGIGAGLTGAFVFADQYQAAMNKMQMATGATAKETKQLSEAVKNVYAANYGQDMNDVAESMTAVKIATGATGKELESLTKYAIGVRDTFGYEVPESTKVADQMMKQFGITGKEAYTLIAQGAQQGLDKNGDMLDTMQEYSVYFKTLGFDAEGMFNVLKAGSDAGAFNLDKVGDAVKELGIRVKDGSKSSTQAFESLGLNADDMAQKFAKGGKSSQEALQQVFQGLSKMKDPVERNTVGVALMGSQFEDLEYKTIQAMGTVQNTADKSAKTLDKMNQVKFNTVGDAIRGVGRVILTEMLDPMQKKVLPFVNKMISQFKTNLPQIKQVASDTFDGMANFLVKMQPTIKNLWSALKPIAEVVGVAIYGAFKALETLLPPITGALSFLIAKFTNMKGFVPIMSGILAAFVTFRLYLLAMRAPAMIIQTISVLTRAWAVAQMLLNTTLLANPVGLVIAAIAGLAAALVVAYKRSETFRNIVNGAWDAIKAKAMTVFNFLKPYIQQAMTAITGFAQQKLGQLKQFWDQNGTQILQAVKNIWGAVSAVFKSVMAVIVPIVKVGLGAILAVFKVVFPVALALVKSVWGNIKGVINGALNIIMGLVKIFSGLFTGNFKTMWAGIKQLFIGVVQFLWNFIQLQMFGKLLSLGKIFITSFRGIFVGLWNGLKTLFTASVGIVKNVVVKGWNLLLSITKGIFNAYRSFLTGIWNFLKSMISKAASAIWNYVKAQWNALKTGTTTIFNAVRKFLSDLWSGIKNTVTKLAGSAKDGVVNAWNTLKNRTTEMFTTIKKKVTSIFDDIVGAAKKLPGRIGDGIKSMASGVKKGVTSFANTLVKAMGKGLNGTITGINWVLEKVGAPKIKEWKVPQYEKGTRNGKHPGGLAVLGDGGEHELYRTPKGQVGLSPNTDTLMNLPKGTEVLSGKQTKQAFSAAGVPMYDGGSGVIGGIKKGASWVGGKASDAYDSSKKYVSKKAGQVADKGQELYEHAKDKTVETAGKVKDLALDVWDYMDDPAALMKKVFGKFIPDLPNLAGAAGDMLKGGVKTVKDKSIDFIKSKLDEYMSFDGGGGDGSTVGPGSGKGGMHPYVEAWYNKVKDKFGPTKFMGGYANRDVRGGSSKSMHAYGRAFDIGGSKDTMSKIAEWARTHMNNLQYAIYNRRIAGPGMGKPWRKYSGENPHTDHVHLDFMTGGGGGKAPSGGASAWRSKIIQAAKQMKESVSPSEVNGIIAQIQRESGGNQSIIQSSAVRDINTRNGNPARGLLQYIPQTFRAYALKGHSNIMSGYDQLLAFFNNTRWRTDLPYGKRGWGPKGNRKYKNGTGLLGHLGGDAIMGDGNKREPFLMPNGLMGLSPAISTLFKDLPKGTVVWKSVEDFMGQLNNGASSILGSNMPSVDLSGISSAGVGSTTTNNYTLKDIQNALTVDVNVQMGDVIMDGRKVAQVTSPYIKKDLVNDIKKDAYKRGIK